MNKPKAPEEKYTDEEVLKIAADAANGEKFLGLYSGEWQSFYPSQSEADFALVNILSHHTQHKPQIIRIFRSSQLGKRDKAQRDDYVNIMLKHLQHISLGIK